jgi:hypothetical protein
VGNGFLKPTISKKRVIINLLRRAWSAKFILLHFSNLFCKGLIFVPNLFCFTFRSKFIFAKVHLECKIYFASLFKFILRVKPFFWECARLTQPTFQHANIEDIECE